MQTDPVGYSAGMNWYLYCGNNPIGWVDPSGNAHYDFEWDDDGVGWEVTIYFDDGRKPVKESGTGFTDFCNIMDNYDYVFDDEWKMKQAAGQLWANSVEANQDNSIFAPSFWEIQFLIESEVFEESEIRELGAKGVKITKRSRYVRDRRTGKLINVGNGYDASTNTVYAVGGISLGDLNWKSSPYYVVLAHELDHAYHSHFRSKDEMWETYAVIRENKARRVCFEHCGESIFPRRTYTWWRAWGGKEFAGKTAKEAWANYNPDLVEY